ncbi:DUF2158 domain-containing protein [Sulfuricurvum sp. IAE1]|uniref:YodC family protein n=1 Tax=Sulfuricurvum sp. IAE1 TaxID=2546102 RepID=UPI0010455D69|nr:DUF2158 domain-containing protein [Sulfuricurvum sp. IAE1]TDA64307.1 DUF2158 domain-containing protein [Sulfuricurvum sp. IAE1]
MFKAGDRVTLKSGGPIMTVESIDEDDSVTCVWYENGEIKRQSFIMTVTLKKVDEAPAAVV